MSAPRKHHFLPRFYLKRFAASGYLWVHDREQGTRRKLRPETVAVRKAFYSVEGEDGRKDHEEVERRLGVIENQAAPAIRKIDAGAALELRERFALAMFVALLKFRTTAFERQMREMDEMLSDPQTAKELLAPSVEGVRAMLRHSGNDHPNLDELAHAFYEHVREHGVHHRSGPNARLEAMLQFTHKLGWEMVVKPWSVARAPEGRSFVVGDHPYVVVSTEEAQDTLHHEGPGVMAPGYEAWVPLSRRSLLIVGDEVHGNRYFPLDGPEVHRTNVMVAAQSERFFMSGDEAELAKTAQALPEEDPSHGWILPGEGPDVVSLDLTGYLGLGHLRPSTNPHD